MTESTPTKSSIYRLPRKVEMPFGYEISVVQDTPDGLKRLVAEHHGEAPTLHAVFMTYTGRSLDEDVEEDESDDDE